MEILSHSTCNFCCIRIVAVNVNEFMMQIKKSVKDIESGHIYSVEMYENVNPAFVRKICFRIIARVLITFSTVYMKVGPFPTKTYNFSCKINNIWLYI